MICQNCSNAIPDGSAFCGFCGQAATAVPPAAPDLSKTVVSEPVPSAPAPNLSKTVVAEPVPPVTAPNLSKTVVAEPEVSIAAPDLSKTVVAEPAPPAPALDLSKTVVPEPEPPVAAPDLSKTVVPEPEPTPEPPVEVLPVVETVACCAPEPAPIPAPVVYEPASVLVDKTAKHMGAWGYVWSDIVLAIPLVGLIMFFVWAFSSKTNKARKSYVRSKFIWFVISLLLSAAVTVFLVPLFPQIIDGFTVAFQNVYGALY